MRMPIDPEPKSSGARFIDVRMRGFSGRTPLRDAIALLDARSLLSRPVETSFQEACGRVLACDVVSPVNLPGFRRAAMDGVAVRSLDTSAAAPTTPVVFPIVGESLPGRPISRAISEGEAMLIMTGAPAPDGADAIIPIELVELIDSACRITAPIGAGKNISPIGEDVAVGRAVLKAGRRLRPQDAALLSAMGVARVAVVDTPAVAILITGDELLPPGSAPEGCRVVDCNSIMLENLIRRDGARPSPVIYASDEASLIRRHLRESTADVILISGGTSVGKVDHAAEVLAETGELLVHGLALRPAGPTGFGWLGQKPVFLLPGNPVSCLCAYDLLASRAIRRLAGLPIDLPYPSEELPIASPIESAAGRVDYVRVRFTPEGVAPVAGRGGSRLSTVVEADGFAIVGEESEGYAVGERVRVYRYDAL